MKLTRGRLNMAIRCLTAENILLIDGKGVNANYKIHGDLWMRYCMRMIARGLAQAQARHKKEQNRRKR